jgi:hypothetical protein
MNTTKARLEPSTHIVPRALSAEPGAGRHCTSRTMCCSRLQRGRDGRALRAGSCERTRNGATCTGVYSPGTASAKGFDLSKERMSVLALLKTAARADEQIEREMARLRIVKDDTCNHDSSV